MTTDLEEPFNQLNILLDTEPALSEIKEWTSKNKSLALQPPALYSYDQNPDFGWFSLWFSSLKQDFEIMIEMTSFFEQNPDNYWFEKDYYKEKTFGLIDGLAEEENAISLFNFLIENPQYAKNITLTETISYMFNTAFENDTYDGFIYSCMNFLMQCDLKVFESLPIHATKNLLNEYDNRLSLNIVPMFALEQDSYLAENNTKKIQTLFERKFVSPELALFLSCQVNVEQDFLESLLKIVPIIQNHEEKNEHNITRDHIIAKNKTNNKFEKFKSFWSHLGKSIFTDDIDLENELDSSTICEYPETGYLHNCLTNGAWQSAEILLKNGSSFYDRYSSEKLSPIQGLLSNPGHMKDWEVSLQYDTNDFIKLFELVQKFGGDIYETYKGKNIFDLMFSGLLKNSAIKLVLESSFKSIPEPLTLLSHLEAAIANCKGNSSIDFEFMKWFDSYKEQLQLKSINTIKKTQKISKL